MNTLTHAAESGDVKGFKKGMRKRLPRNERTTAILESTESLFESRPRPNLFGSSDAEELAAAFREAVATSDGSPSDEINRAAATPYVPELVRIARMRNPLQAPVAESEVFEVTYQLRVILRGGQ